MYNYCCGNGIVHVVVLNSRQLLQQFSVIITCGVLLQLYACSLEHCTLAKHCIIPIVDLCSLSLMITMHSSKYEV